jgi:peptidoglycan lytic transglycosylase F
VNDRLYNDRMLAAAAFVPLLALALPDTFAVESKSARKGAGGDTENLAWELTRHTRERYVGDLDEIKKKGVLRVLTRNNSSAYYISKGEQRGFEFELARELAKNLGVRLAIMVPSSRDDLISILLAGGGDLIAAGMTVTSTRAEQLRFTTPMLRSARYVVTHALDRRLILGPEDLDQTAIHVRFSSTTFTTAKLLEKELPFMLPITEIKEGMEMEEMLERVVSGEYDATIVDEDVFVLEQAVGLPIAARLDIGEPLPKAWATRPDSIALHAVADAFIRKHLRDGLIRILYQRYYLPASKAAAVAHDFDMRADARGRISPYDELFKKEADANRIDWRLLAAIAFTESRFDPAAASPFGAVGLMQVLPATAKEVGISPLGDVASNIRAGARLLRRLIDSFAEDGLEERQQVRFAIAAYNVGLGHVKDARTIATEVGLDKNVWFKNVEEALRLKKLPKWHEKSKFGYCRADEPIQYVSKVQSWYDVYVRYLPGR